MILHHSQDLWKFWEHQHYHYLLWPFGLPRSLPQPFGVSTTALSLSLFIATHMIKEEPAGVRPMIIHFPFTMVTSK